LFAPHTYIFVLHAHPVRGESYNQRNTTGEVATLQRFYQLFPTTLPVGKKSVLSSNQDLTGALSRVFNFQSDVNCHPILQQI